MVNTPARARLAIHGVAGGGHHEALRDMPDGSAAERQVLPRLRLSLGTPRLPRVLHHTPGERQVLPRVRPLDGDLLDVRRRGNEPRVDGRGGGGDRPRADGRGGGGDLGPRLARRVVVVAARSEAGVPQMQGVEARLRPGAADLRAVRAPRYALAAACLPGCSRHAVDFGPHEQRGLGDYDSSAHDWWWLCQLSDGHRNCLRRLTPLFVFRKFSLRKHG